MSDQLSHRTKPTLPATAPGEPVEYSKKIQKKVRGGATGRGKSLGIMIVVVLCALTGAAWIFRDDINLMLSPREDRRPSFPKALSATGNSYPSKKNVDNADLTAKTGSLPIDKAVKAFKHTPEYSCEEVRLGQARFQVMTPQMIRMEFFEDSSQDCNDFATFVIVNRNVPCVPFTKTVSANGITIDTDFIHLEYSGNGKPSAAFTPRNLKATILLEDGKKVAWTPGMKNPGRMFGTIRTLDRVSGAFSLDCDTLPMQSRHPHSGVAQHCTYGIISKSGWTVIDDSKSPIFDDSDWPWVGQLPNNSIRQDWYLLGHGHSYRQALKDFSLVAGNQPIPPRFAFGIFYSRWWPWADWESMQIIKEYDLNSVPLDVMVTDMDWHNTCYREQDQGYTDLAGQPACWTGWTWDTKYFPDPKGFMDWCHKRGIKNTLNAHLASGVQPWEERFPQIAAAMGLDPLDKKAYVEWNVTDKKFSINFHHHVLKPIEDQGVDFWWLDWQQGEGWFMDTFPNLTPTFYLNYVYFTQPERWNNGDRPLVLHRWGGLGNHRYPVGFSGDVYPNWDSLAYQPYMTRESANVLFGYWSHDIGGFMEPAGDELYLRWIQYGIFSPIFRTHGTRMAENKKKMWFYNPIFFRAMRAAMQLRSKMIPYLYTAAREAFDTGVSVCYPLYYDFPEAEEAYSFKTQYMFGSQIMVAPVVTPANEITQLVEDMEIWIPSGDWIEVMSGRTFTGPTVVKRSFSMNEIPFFVKSGSIIVNRLIGPEEEKVNKGWLGRTQEIPDGYEVNLYLPKDIKTESTHHVMHYEDSGDNVDYAKDKFAWRKFSYTVRNGYLDVTIAKPEGTFEAMPANQYYRVIVHLSAPPEKVLVNGAPVVYQPWADFDPHEDKDTWYYDGSKIAAVVNLYQWYATDSDVTISITYPSYFTNTIRGKIDGLPGKIARAQAAKYSLDSSYPETAPSDYEETTRFAETGMRLSYTPRMFSEEMGMVEAKWKAAVAHATQFKKGFRMKRSANLEKKVAALVVKL